MGRPFFFKRRKIKRPFAARQADVEFFVYSDILGPGKGFANRQPMFNHVFVLKPVLGGANPPVLAKNRVLSARNMLFLPYQKAAGSERAALSENAQMVQKAT
jgi:hypothetical protein